MAGPHRPKAAYGRPGCLVLDSGRHGKSRHRSLRSGNRRRERKGIPMKSFFPQLLILVGCLGLGFDARASAPPHQWSQRFGAARFDGARSVVKDASGNVFITGYFSDTINFGGGDLHTGMFSDIFLAKFNAAGVHQWSRGFGDGQFNDVGLSVATDASGNVIVTGTFEGTVNFGGGNLTSAGSDDIFVAKFNAAGVHQWSQRFGDVTF